MRPRGSVASALVGAAVLVLLTGCGGEDGGSDVPTRAPATAAVSPATANPVGQVFPAAATKALLAESSTGRLAALDTAGTALSLIDPAAPTAPRTVGLPAVGASLSQGKPGEVLVAAPDRVLRVDVTTGTLTETPVDGDARSVRTRTDGTLVVGTADGTVRELTADGAVTRTITGLVSADEIALTGENITVLDRKQTAVVAVGQDALGLMLRAGRRRHQRHRRPARPHHRGRHDGRRTARLLGRSARAAPAFPGIIIALRARLRPSFGHGLGELHAEQRGRRLRPVDRHRCRGGQARDAAPARRDNRRRTHRRPVRGLGCG